MKTSFSTFPLVALAGLNLTWGKGIQVLSRQDFENTAFLIEKVKEGDEQARERLFRNFLPKLQRWAKGRIPFQARSLAETDDLVQTTLLKAFRRIQNFESRGEGAFLAYLRQILMNEIRDLAVKPGSNTLDLDMELEKSSENPERKQLTREARERYERGLDKLPELAKQGIIMRLEFEYSYAEIAEALDKPSTDAARMFVTRAIQQLAKEMTDATC